MSYLEQKEVKTKTYVSFVKKITFMKHQLVIKKYIGPADSKINKEKYLLDNLQEISHKEFQFRLKYLEPIKNRLSYNASLPEEVEKRTIEINNLIEGKQCTNLVDSEFAMEFTFNSNNIEGSKIPPDVVRQIVETGSTKYKNKNEIREVKNSITALNYLKGSFRFNIQSIKKLYHLLTHELYMENKIPYPRGFKKVKNIIGNSTTTPPEEVAKELDKLLSWYKDNKDKIHPLILAFEFHRRYESIHPFLDCNGRTGRLIMNKILINAGYFPIVIYKENKTAYFNYLEKSKEGKTKVCYQFMLEQARKTYDYILHILDKY
ncbi:MAG: Fic family protein [Candidatus Pacearchaeota archaeon]|nr:Fic family protein [Candidatus Pacearchaeota archaeon]